MTRDLRRFGSTEGDEVWKAQVKQAAQVLTRGYVAPEDAEDALQQLEQAAALSNEHAWLWYLQGRALERLGRGMPKRRRAFRKARDLDTMPWRAPTVHNAVIRAVVKEHGAVLADVEAAFADAAPAQGSGLGVDGGSRSLLCCWAGFVGADCFSTASPDWRRLTWDCCGARRCIGAI